jgi:hypothetical protein
MKKKILAMFMAVVMMIGVVPIVSVNVGADYCNHDNLDYDNPIEVTDCRTRWLCLDCGTDSVSTVHCGNNGTVTDIGNWIINDFHNFCQGTGICTVCNTTATVYCSNNNRNSLETVVTGCVTAQACSICDYAWSWSRPSASVDCKPFNCVCGYVPSVRRGHVTGGDKIGINDALEVLKHLAGITTLTGNAFEAALITPQSQSSRKISIGDVLEILKHLAGISKIN